MPISAIDEDRVAKGNVEAVFDDRGRDKNIGFVAHEAEHDFLEFTFGHLSMADNHARSWDELLNLCSDFVDALNAIVNKVGLSATLEFMLDGRANELLIEWSDDRLDGHAVFRRRFDHTHVAQADE